MQHPNWIAQARQVEAHPTGRRDRYGRIVARIEIDGVDLGERLIARGLAQPWRGAESELLLRRVVIANRSMRLRPLPH